MPFPVQHTRRLWRVFALIGLAALVGTAGVAPAARADYNKQGLQDGWAIGDDGTTGPWAQLLPEQFPRMQAVGATEVRINFRLGACYRDWTTRVPTEDVSSRGCDPSVVGKTAVDAYDGVIAEATRHGLTVLGLLPNESWHGDQSKWTASNAENNRRGTGDNSYIRNFAQKAAGVLAGKYAGGRTAQALDAKTYEVRVGAWEVWNEPNAWENNPRPGVYTGSSFIYPSNFAWLLKRSYEAIKKANPAATVVSGGVFGHEIGGTVTTALEKDGSRRQVLRQGTYRAPAGSPNAAATEVQAASTCPGADVSGARYLCSTYEMGIAKAGWVKPYPLDQVGQHLYIDQGRTTTSGKIVGYLDDVRGAYGYFEDPANAKQTVVTEFGWPEPAGANPSLQAANLKTAFDTFHATAYVVRGYWFRTQDLDPAYDYHGLFAPNGVMKPSGTMFHCLTTTATC